MNKAKQIDHGEYLYAYVNAAQHRKKLFLTQQILTIEKRYRSVALILGRNTGWLKSYGKLEFRNDFFAHSHARLHFCSFARNAPFAFDDELLCD